MVQWLRLNTSIAGDPGSIPDSGTKIPQATWGHQKVLKKRENRISKISWGRPQRDYLLFQINGIKQPVGGSVVKNLPANAADAGDVGLSPVLERSPGGGSGNSPQYSHLENPMDRGDWRATVHGVAKSWTRLRD